MEILIILLQQIFVQLQKDQIQEHFHQVDFKEIMEKLPVICYHFYYNINQIHILHFYYINLHRALLIFPFTL